MKKLLLVLMAVLGASLISQPNIAQAQDNIPDYKVTWQTTDFLTVTLLGLPDGWTRKILALGPANWLVTYQGNKQSNCSNEDDPNCYAQKNHENWKIPDLTRDCFVRFNANCTPDDPDDFDEAKWLWATGGCLVAHTNNVCYYPGINAYNPVFEIRPTSDSRLYQNNAYRGEGPALFWENNTSGDQAVWAQGAYGYAQGGIAAPGNEARAGINIIGTMIPLRWSVEGFLND